MTASKPQHTATANILDKVKLYFEESKNRRGWFLELTTGLDQALDEIISMFLGSETDWHKREFLEGEIIAGMTFSRKIQIFEKILKTYHPEILNANPTLIKKLNTLREFRNDLAHGFLKTDSSTIQGRKEGELTYMAFKNGRRTPRVVSKDFFDKKCVECTDTFSKLMILRPEIIKFYTNLNKPQ